MKFVVRNGLLCSGISIHAGDLLIENDKIIAVGNLGEIDSSIQVVDATGCYVLPGLIDLHVHLDDIIGGIPLADSYRSGSTIAVENGITTLWSFITQRLHESLTDAIERTRGKAIGNSFANLGWHLTPIRFDGAGWKEINEAIERGFRTFKFYTTYRQANLFTSYFELRRVFLQLAEKHCRAFIHCEDEEVLEVGKKEIESFEPLSHARLRTPKAELTAVSEIIELAESTDMAVHVVHVSTPEAVDRIMQARWSMEITCETAPHYWTFDENKLASEAGHRFLCSPPFRDRARVDRMRQIAIDGLIDLFATDHCAFFKSDKDCSPGDCRTTPNGIPGIGALPHMTAKLGANPHDAMSIISRRISEEPAKLLSLYPRKGALRPGSDADFSIVKWDDVAHPICSTHSDCYDPFESETTHLRFEQVFVGGVAMAIGGTLLPGAEPGGGLLCPTR